MTKFKFITKRARTSFSNITKLSILYKHVPAPTQINNACSISRGESEKQID